MSITNIVVECAKVCDKSEVILVEVSVTINRQHTPNLDKKTILVYECDYRVSSKKTLPLIIPAILMAH